MEKKDILKIFGSMEEYNYCCYVGKWRKLYKENYGTIDPEKIRVSMNELVKIDDCNKVLDYLNIARVRTELQKQKAIEGNWSNYAISTYDESLMINECLRLSAENRKEEIKSLENK